MIGINLLPEAYRRPERTSPKVFATALFGVVLVCSSIGWFGMVYFGDLDRIQIKHQSVAETLAGVTERAKLYDDLVQERKDFSKRADTIKNIAKGRRLWVQFLDELIDVVTNGGDKDRHVAWFGSMQVRGSRDGRKGPQIQFPAHVQGNDIRKIANLHDDVEKARFFVDMEEYSPPAGSKDVDEGLYPSESFSFNWKWQMKPSAEWAKSQTSTAAKPK